MWNELFIIVVIASHTNFQHNSFDKEEYLECYKNYAEEFVPSYFDNSNELVVAQIPMPSDTMNAFLMHCKQKDVEEAYLYSFLIILKLQEEFLTKNETDYGFCGYEGNEIVELALNKIGLELDPIGCDFIKSNLIFKYLSQNKDYLEIYDPLKHQYLKNRTLINTLIKKKNSN
jgi:hypothetical protein